MKNLLATEISKKRYLSLLPTKQNLPQGLFIGVLGKGRSGDCGLDYVGHLVHLVQCEPDDPVGTWIH